MVQVLEINRHDGSPWARVVVAVLKGKCCGRIGQISIDMSARLQRSWQRLTMSSSMETGRAPAVSDLRVLDHKTTPAAALTVGARTPPNDGFFDTTAAYVGAFRDGTDDWLSGWARFDDQ